jgi:hypothetical protein
MKKIIIHITFAAILLAAGWVGITQKAAADQVYHTEHLVLEPVDGAPLQSGFVNNIHPNGEMVFAHEVYQLNGAAPFTTYQVMLNGYPEGSNCKGAPALAINTAVLVTNKSGNAKAEVFFTPEGVVGLNDQTFNIQWQVWNGASLDYQTICTVVTLD